MCLMKGGVPFDIAWAMADSAEMTPAVLAWIVIMGEIEGGEFDWARLKWRDKTDVS